MDLANLLQGSAPKSYSATYGKRSAPLSPPVEEPKCSLPSISTLLENADGHAAKRPRLSPTSRTSDARYDSIRLPPTPPLRPGSGVGLNNSRHSHSPIESLSKAPTEPSARTHRTSISSTGSIHLPAGPGPYASPAPSVSSYSSIEAPQSNQAMYYTRPPTASTFAPTAPLPAPPLPTQHQPQAHAAAPAPAPASASASVSGSTTAPTTAPTHPITPVTPAWQHHHYFPPSTTTTYQQNHDRYICRTCHKAFSRPSSLRIHSHSHTGEKPFRCTHAGCGKAFSVRSNMKRHERGCHSGRPVAATPAATALVS